HTATPDIFTLSLHDALPILIGSARAQSPYRLPPIWVADRALGEAARRVCRNSARPDANGASGRRRRSERSQTAAHKRRATRTARSEEHTSELQSLAYLVCRL